MAETGGGTAAGGSARTDPGSDHLSSTDDVQQEPAPRAGDDEVNTPTADTGETSGLSSPAEVEPARAYRKRRGRPSRARGQPNSSDAASARWTIRGVPPHIRDMALKAAEARGMTVGDWLAEAIVGFVRGSGKPAAAGEQRSNLPTAEAPPDLVDMMTRLETRLTRLEERQTLGFFGRLFGRRR